MIATRKQFSSDDALANAPQDVMDAYFKARESFAGTDEEESHSSAMRAVQHAGFYRVGNQWKRLGPDVREKVNLRRAERQPDGRYLVCDVDVFYPNAAKGADTQFDADRIGQIIINTNRAIESGGQRPSLTKIHPSPLSKAMGTFIPSYGHAINFRESPRGKGWMRCDLADIDPEVIGDWKLRRATGLSAGIVDDAGLNERVGHVAMLGGESQALAQLPVTEVFSTDGMVCFSAEIPKDMRPIMNAKLFAAMKDCYSGLATAYAAAESGEVGADKKIEEAKGRLAAAEKEFNADPMGGCGMPPMGGAMPPAGGAPGMTPGDAAPPPPPPAFDAKSPLPEEPALGGPTQPSTKMEFSAEMRETVRRLEMQNAALLGQAARRDFSAKCDELRRKGHQFDQVAIDKMFAASIGNKDQMEALYEFLGKTPVQANPASFGAVFGAEGGHSFAAGSEGDEREIVSMLRKSLPGTNFSADDLKFGMKLAGLVGKQK